MLHDKDLLSIQEVRSKVEKAYAAWQQYRTYTQEQVDAIVERMAAAGRAQSRRLAELAVEETGYGNVPDKIAKNLLNADLLPRRMRGQRTVGVLRELPEEKVVEIGVPLGVVAAILPTTNPTSTAIFKILISLKAGNAIVLSPHPRAFRCTCETANVLYRAALEAGAPENIIQCVEAATIEGTNTLMRHDRVGVILATGGSGMVRAAYTSGKPAFGVGPGNVPVYVERSADVKDAIAKVVAGKSFDYGTVCSSEQAVVAEEALRDKVIAELSANKAFFCDEQQKAALGKLLVTPNWTINPKCVGQAPTRIAEMAGFRVPADTTILVATMNGVGKEHPLSMEKLSPVLALYLAPDHEQCLKLCEALLRFGGLGHTCVIFSNDDARVREFGARMPAYRVLVNTSAPQGSTGITTNVWPSMTLGCGAVAGNSTSDNVGPQHLINIKRIAWAVRRPEEALRIPAEGEAPAAESGVPVSKATVAAAVERYLAGRGMAVQPAAAPVPAAAPRTTAAEVVDRFLAARGKRNPTEMPRAEAPASPVPSAESLCCGRSAQAEAAACPVPPAPPAPEVPIADFVCEDDVRKAMRDSKKIYIGPKSIVTPSARDLGDRFDILVMARR